MKFAKLQEDWTIILELLQQRKERTAALLVAKKASKPFFSSACVVYAGIHHILDRNTTSPHLVNLQHLESKIIEKMGLNTGIEVRLS